MAYVQSQIADTTADLGAGAPVIGNCGFGVRGRVSLCPCPNSHCPLAVPGEALPEDGELPAPRPLLFSSLSSPISLFCLSLLPSSPLLLSSISSFCPHKPHLLCLPFLRFLGPSSSCTPTPCSSGAPGGSHCPQHPPGICPLLGSGALGRPSGAGKPVSIWEKRPQPLLRNRQEMLLEPRSFLCRPIH